MKLTIFSDLHLEFGPMDFPFTDDEDNTICVLAGDIGIATKPATYMDAFEEVTSRFKHTIVIPGNHEHYRGYFQTTVPIMLETCNDLSNFSFGDRYTTVIDDVAFVCATLWTDFDNGSPTTQWFAQQRMADFKYIKNGPTHAPWKRKFSPPYARQEFAMSKKFIFEETAKHKELGHKVVIVTHHAPSHESAADEYKNDELAGAYASDLQQEIIDTKPNLYIHGHMHSSSDYMIGDTRVICNPRGYHPDYLNEDFNPTMIIEV